MRRTVVAVVAAVITLVASPASAEEFSACWVAVETVPGVGVEQTVTRCRIAGGEVVDYASDDSVPSVLYPSAGVDLTGDCWYYTSTETQWISLAYYLNGDADLGWLPDPDNPLAVIYATGRVPRCASEPGVTVDPTAVVWAYVTQYVHPPPSPDVNPEQGNGVTGMKTFVGVPIPEDHVTQLSAGGLTLDVEIEVSGVIVDWGDGRSDTFPASSTALAGYPSGIAVHVYETKAADGYDLAVSYDWTARWRVVGDTWEFLAVPNTTTVVGYPVNEIVSVITD